MILPERQQALKSEQCLPGDTTSVGSLISAFSFVGLACSKPEKVQLLRVRVRETPKKEITEWAPWLCSI